jgi:hypothetical protein
MSRHHRNRFRDIEKELTRRGLTWDAIAALMRERAGLLAAPEDAPAKLAPASRRRASTVERPAAGIYPRQAERGLAQRPVGRVLG